MPLPEHRASDAEREATADRLRVAAGDGRLDPEELEERLEAAYAARTVGELTELTEDLPQPRLPGESRAGPLRSQHVRARLASFITVNAICIAIWAATGAESYFWPIWVIFGTGIGLFTTVVRTLLGVEEEDDREHHGRRLPKPPRSPGLPPG
jgi:Domain of unknown function (DUF1707)/2TM domain